MGFSRVRHAYVLRRREVDEPRRASLVIRIEDRLDFPIAVADPLTSKKYALRRFVGELKIGDRGDWNAFGDKIAFVDPPPHDALRVAEQADRQFLAASRKRVSMSRLAIW